MNVIVTGGAGFLGSHLIELLISKNHYPIIIDNLTTGKYKFIKKFIDSKKAKFFKIDLRNYKNLKRIPDADAIIHLGAIASISESTINPRYVNDVNVIGTLNMLEICKEKKIKKFIFISSAAVFGDNKKKLSESSMTDPTSIYGLTKLIGEHYCRIYSKLFGINCIVFRPFNIFGPRQNKEYAAVIPKFLSKINSNKPPIIFGDGKQTRDFIHVSDVINALTLALKYDKSSFEIFNLATGNSISINHLSKICITLAKKKNLKAIYKKGFVGISQSSANISKIKKNLNFIPEKDLSEGLSELLE